jgi:CspA family cold shock protein
VRAQRNDDFAHIGLRADRGIETASRAIPPLRRTEKNMAQNTGEVKWFNNAKGFGFVGHDGGPDVFCHYSSIQAEGFKALKEGDRVSFDIVTGESGRPQTHDVKKLA